MPLLSGEQSFAKNLIVTSPFVIFSISFQKIVFLDKMMKTDFSAI
jgi:hypothetical protein